MTLQGYVKKNFNGKWVNVTLQKTFQGNTDDEGYSEWESTLQGKIKTFGDFVELMFTSGAKLVVRYEDILMIEDYHDPDEMERTYRLSLAEKRAIKVMDNAAKKVLKPCSRKDRV